MGVKITNEKILSEIKRIHNEFGKVTKPLLMKHASVSYDTIKRRFGSMRAALTLVHIEPSQGQRKMITREEVVKDLHRVHLEQGRMSKPIYEQHGIYTPKVVQRIFGSFGVMMSELQYEQHPSGYKPSDEELIADLQKLFLEHGIVTSNIIRYYGKFSVFVYDNRFGDVNQAYVAAGLETRKPGEPVYADYVIRRFAKTIGEEPEYEKRFDWLRNPKTNRHLPIDGYFPKANIAIEYNGPQHYRLDSLYMRTQEKLDYRIKLDALKYELIRQHGIKLIVIHYKDPINQHYIDNHLA